MSANSYCISLKTGRIAASSPNLLKNKNNMVLSNDNPAVALHVDHGIQSFDVILNGTGVGYVFKPVIPPAPRADAPPERFDAYNKMLAAVSGMDPSPQEMADMTRVDPMQVGLTVQAPDGELYTQDLIAEVRGGQRYEVPSDFDLDLDLQPMDKPALVNIATTIKGFPLPQNVKVKQLRVMLQDAIGEIKSYPKQVVGTAIETDDEGNEVEVPVEQHVAEPEGQQGFPVPPQQTQEQLRDVRETKLAEQYTERGGLVPAAPPVPPLTGPAGEPVTLLDEVDATPPAMDLGGELPPPATGVNTPSPAEAMAAQNEAAQQQAAQQQAATPAPVPAPPAAPPAPSA